MPNDTRTIQLAIHFELGEGAAKALLDHLTQHQGLALYGQPLPSIPVVGVTVDELCSDANGVYAESARRARTWLAQRIARAAADIPLPPTTTEQLTEELQRRTFRYGWEADVEHAIRSWVTDTSALGLRISGVNASVETIGGELLSLAARVGLANITVVLAKRLSSAINVVANTACVLDYERNDHNDRAAHTAIARAAWRVRDYLVIAHNRMGETN